MNQTNSVFVLKILTGPYKGKALKLLSSEIKIGRSTDCDLILKEDPFCALQHALIKKEEDSFSITSLDSKNPVLINKRARPFHILKNKDKIQIGNIKMVFVESTAKKERPLPPPPKNRAIKLTPPRLFFLLILGGGLFFLLSENSTQNKTAKTFTLKTEQDTLNQIEEINKQTEQEIESLSLNFKQKGARAFFIEGFRDYRKGYFQRALKMFSSCEKDNELCKRYKGKAKSQIDKLIQNKIRVGNAYKEKKQYSACTATFKSVEIMLEDTSSPLYKEVQAKKLACAIHLRNKI